MECTYQDCKETKLHAYGMCSKHYTKSDRWRELNKINQRKYRKEGRAWYKKSIKKMRASPNYRLHQAAQAAVRFALKQGYLNRELCSCGKKAEAHHDSYLVQDWLKVCWLCRSCHKVWHLENKPTY